MNDEFQKDYVQWLIKVKKIKPNPTQLQSAYKIHIDEFLNTLSPQKMIHYNLQIQEDALDVKEFLKRVRSFEKDYNMKDLVYIDMQCSSEPYMGTIVENGVHKILQKAFIDCPNNEDLRNMTSFSIAELCISTNKRDVN